MITKNQIAYTMGRGYPKLSGQDTRSTKSIITIMHNRKMGFHLGKKGDEMPAKGIVAPLRRSMKKIHFLAGSVSVVIEKIHEMLTAIQSGSKVNKSKIRKIYWKSFFQH